VGVNTPEPSLTVRPDRYTPALASTNADASIGDGAGSGSWWIDGHVMNIEACFTWGTTSTFGTGSLLVPLPPGFTAADIDFNRMTVIGFGTVGAPCVCIKALGGVQTNVVCFAIDVFGIVFAVTVVAGDFVGIAQNDQIFISAQFPLLEPAIPDGA
jgi:hypothetical protein